MFKTDSTLTKTYDCHPAQQNRADFELAFRRNRSRKRAETSEEPIDVLDRLKRLRSFERARCVCLSLSDKKLQYATELAQN